MSKNYDYALALIENDVRNDCEYYVYSRLRDVVDGLENDNEALTRLLKDALEKKYSKEDELQAENAKLRELLHDAAVELYVNGNVTDASTELLFDQMRKMGIEAEYDSVS